MGCHQPIPFLLGKCEVRIKRLKLDFSGYLGQHSMEDIAEIIDTTISSLGWNGEVSEDTLGKIGSSQLTPNLKTANMRSSVVSCCSGGANTEYTQPSFCYKTGETNKENFLHGLGLETKTVQSTVSKCREDISQVRKYGTIRVTRRSSFVCRPSESPLSPSSGSSQSFSDYKRRMQSKLKAKVAITSFSEKFEMDIDSDLDSDDDPAWGPPENEEEVDDTFDSGDEKLTKSRLSFNSVMSDKYKCDNCEKYYQKYGHLLKHMRKCSGLEIKIEIKLEEGFNERQCQECGVILATAGSLKRHMINIHTEVSNNVSRELRPKSKMLNSPVTRKFLGEIVTRNKIPDGVNCNPSDISFIGEKLKEPLKCLKCGRKFVKPGHLIKHMKVVHQSPVKFVNPVLVDPDLNVKNLCDLCQQSFATPASLRRHLRLHESDPVKTEYLSPSKSNRFFSCKECGNKFTAHPSLKRHILTDHRGFKSTCNICGKAVARLDTHVLVHQDRLTSCFICRKLLTPSCLARHVRTVHKGCLVRCVECDKFVSNIHKHMTDSHPFACQIKREGHRDHSDCDCVFYLGPNSIFKRD